MHKKENIISFYNIILAILAIVSLLSYIYRLFFKISVEASNTIKIINMVIYFMFLFQYLYELIKSKNKKKFIKENAFDLISIIPFSDFFRIFKIFRVVRSIRIIKIKYKSLFRFFKKSKFQNMLYINFLVVMVGTIFISILEKKNFNDSLWFALVTITTVGYGDITVTTDIGRVVAFILMLSGIGSVSYLTSRIASYFIDNKEEIDQKEKIANQIIDSLKLYDSLSESEIDELCDILKKLKK